VALPKHDWMQAFVNLVHTGSYLTSSLNEHFQRELDISLPEQDLLNVLEKVGGEVKMVDLARRVFLSKAGMTKMVDRLESAGLVERLPSRSDRRVTSARLTRRGRSLLHRSRERLEAWVAENFRRHLADDEVAALGNALRTLLEGLGRWEGQQAHLRGQPHE
jgi:DNA-binding MarR family transcriptional regulator